MTVTKRNRLNKSSLRNKTTHNRKTHGGVGMVSFSDYNLGMSEKINGGRKKRTGGRGILSDIAVPVVLLYANNTIGKSKSKNSFKSRKSRKTKKRSSRK